MDLLTEVQGYMAFLGWKGNPITGFTHKEAAGGLIIARHRDAVWRSDVETAIDWVERQAAVREVERRQRDLGAAVRH